MSGPKDHTAAVSTVISVMNSALDIFIYPLKMMSTVMQATRAQGNWVKPATSVEVRLYEKTTLQGVNPGFAARIPWPTYPRTAFFYNDSVNGTFGDGFRGLYKGFLIMHFIQLLIPSGRVKSGSEASRKEYIRAYLDMMIAFTFLKPLKTAHTRFVLQKRNDKTYNSLKDFFHKVPIREQYQGFTITMMRETLGFFVSTQPIHFSLVVLMFYPFYVAETRMEAMSGDKNMQSRRYTSRNIVSKILSEEGLRGLYRGFFASMMYVRPTQQSFFFMSTMALASVFREVELRRQQRKREKKERGSNVDR